MITVQFVSIVTVTDLTEVSWSIVGTTEVRSRQPLDQGPLNGHRSDAKFTIFLSIIGLNCKKYLFIDKISNQTLPIFSSI